MNGRFSSPPSCAANFCNVLTHTAQERYGATRIKTDLEIKKNRKRTFYGSPHTGNRGSRYRARTTIRPSPKSICVTRSCECTCIYALTRAAAAGHRLATPLPVRHNARIAVGNAKTNQAWCMRYSRALLSVSNETLRKRSDPRQKDSKCALRPARLRNRGALEFEPFFFRASTRGITRHTNRSSSTSSIVTSSKRRIADPHALSTPLRKYAKRVG